MVDSPAGPDTKSTAKEKVLRSVIALTSRRRRPSNFLLLELMSIRHGACLMYSKLHPSRLETQRISDAIKAQCRIATGRRNIRTVSSAHESAASFGPEPRRVRPIACAGWAGLARRLGYPTCARALGAVVPTFCPHLPTALEMLGLLSYVAHLIDRSDTKTAP